MAVSTIKDNTSKWKYNGDVNNIHWSQWSCPADGIVVFDFSLLTTSVSWHYYIKDITSDIFVGKASGTSANGTSRTITFPVMKGHTYQMQSNAGISGTGLHYRYFEFI